MKKFIKSITAFTLAAACICGGSFITSNNTDSSELKTVSAAEANPISYSGFTYQYSAYYSRIFGRSMYIEYYQGRKTGAIVDGASRYLK